MLNCERERCIILGIIAVLTALLLHGCELPEVKHCTKTGQNCLKTGCCLDPSLQCYTRDDYWASCQESCTPGYTNACNKVSEGGKVHFPSTTTGPSTIAGLTTTTKEKLDWITGTWTTGYWDCCKPSCSWPGKGKVDHPVRACDAEGNVLTNEDAKSICQGGPATTCISNQPFIVNNNLAMGFAAAAVSGNHGLVGDKNCGMCYELMFVDKKHADSWGGASPNLVDKRMIVQVSNIGKDVKGEHSFDILIPGAGQGIFTNGCAAQFPKSEVGDFDCDKRYGGCNKKKGCARLPESLQDGCEWRFDWFEWLKDEGQTNNPFVKFRRVQCPKELTDISGSVPDDDFIQPKMLSVSASDDDEVTDN